MAPGTLTMKQLASQSGITARTLRDWIKQRLLPAPSGHGRGARYDDRHLLRARLVQQLRATGEPLRKVRARLATLSEQELSALARDTHATRHPDSAPRPPETPTYPFTTWESVHLMDGLTLMVDPGRGPGMRRIADDIYRHYGIRAAVSKV